MKIISSVLSIDCRYINIISIFKLNQRFSSLKINNSSGFYCNRISLRVGLGQSLKMSKKMIFSFLFLLAFLGSSSGAKLQVHQDGLYFNGQKVFLSGNKK
jgi:hypothetical protein